MAEAEEPVNAADESAGFLLGEFSVGVHHGAGGEALVFEVVLVTAGFPFGEVVFVDGIGQRSGARAGKLADNVGVREAIIEHAIDLVANEDGKASDFALAASGCKMRAWQRLVTGDLGGSVGVRGQLV